MPLKTFYKNRGPEEGKKIGITYSFIPFSLSLLLMLSLLFSASILNLREF